MSRFDGSAVKSSSRVFKVALVMCLVTLSRGESVHAAESTDPCVTQKDTLEINACTKRQFDAAEADLNSTYKAVLAKLALPDGLGRGQDAIRRLLVESQRHWVTFRERNCDAVQLLNADGAIRTYMYLSCRQQIAEERTKQLRLWFFEQ
jgi:uncharacterized protein YecT (DUF1311 family)